MTEDQRRDAQLFAHSLVLKSLIANLNATPEELASYARAAREELDLDSFAAEQPFLREVARFVDALFIGGTDGFPDDLLTEPR